MKLLKLLLILLCVTIQVNAKDAADIFTTKEIVWFGLDFTKATMIGVGDFKPGEEIKKEYFSSWNDIINKERNKYNIHEIFNVEKVSYNVALVRERNKLVNADKIVTNDYAKIPESEIQEIIKQYKINDYKDGIGLVFIIESFNKPADIGIMYVTFFDIATKKVLLAKKMSGKPGGFGLRNYWIRSVYNVMKEIKEIRYLEWESKYNPKK